MDIKTSFFENIRKNLSYLKHWRWPPQTLMHLSAKLVMELCTIYEHCQVLTLSAVLYLAYFYWTVILCPVDSYILVKKTAIDWW